MHWWENNFLKVKEGKLYLDNREAVSLARKWGIPLFVYSKKQILSNFRNLVETFHGHNSLKIHIFYAMKANPNRKLLKILKAAGAGIDAVSPGEVAEALKVGFPPSKIIFTGTSLSQEDMSYAFAVDGLTVNIDAEEQLEIMKEVKQRLGKDKKIRVSIRWNPGIGSGFTSKVVTAGRIAPDGTPIKFGIEEKKVFRVFDKAYNYGFLPVALHQHLGSGWVKEDFPAVKQAVDKIIDKALEIQKRGFKLEFLDFGGGFGPRYAEDQEIFPLEKYAQYIGHQLAQSGLQLKAIALEPGKYLVGDAGVLLLRVEYLKQNYGNLFACVNAGTFNTVPRPAIYTQAHHPIINCSRLQSKNKATVTVAGNLCETGDVFARKIALPLPKRGDILALLCAGAYCRSMASSFNLRPIPPEIII